MRTSYCTDLLCIFYVAMVKNYMVTVENTISLCRERFASSFQSATNVHFCGAVGDPLITQGMCLLKGCSSAILLKDVEKGKLVSN